MSVKMRLTRIWIRCQNSCHIPIMGRSWFVSCGEAVMEMGLRLVMRFEV